MVRGKGGGGGNAWPYHVCFMASPRLAAAFQLTRFSVALGAMADIWLVLIITRSDNGYVMVPAFSVPWIIAAVAGAVIALGLCGFAAALNDALDVRHDAAFHPHRPIPSGRVPVAQAAVLVIAGLLLGLAAASALGTWPVRMALLTAAAILFYNAVGKFVPAVGLVTVGLIYAAHMLIPNIELTFVLPVWLVMTHAMVCAMGIHTLENKRPRLSPRGWVGVLLGWCFWSGVLLVGPYARTGTLLPAGMSLMDLIWPAAAVLGFAMTARWKVAGAASHASAAEKLRRYGALWECLYAAAWLAALGLHGWAIGMLAFAAAGFGTVTIVKETIGAGHAATAWRVR